MMKKYYYFAICLCAALTGLYLMSCGNDDDDNNGNALVGTWCEDDNGSGYYSGYDDEYTTFFSDGTGFTYEMEHSGKDTYLDDVREFSYIYDEKNMRLVATLKDYTDYTIIIDVVSISSKKLVVRNSSYSSTETRSFSKVSNPVTRKDLEREARGDYSSSYYY